MSLPGLFVLSLLTCLGVIALAKLTIQAAVERTKGRPTPGLLKSHALSLSAGVIPGLLLGATAMSLLSLKANQVLASLSLGIVAGLISSAGTWWLLTRLPVPRLHICEQLVVTDVGDRDICYVKYWNSGRRDAVQIKATGRVRITGLERPGFHIWLTVLEQDIPYMTRRGDRMIRVGTHSMTPNSLEMFRRGVKPEDAERLDNGEALHLAEIMSYGTSAYFVLALTAQDGYSSASNLIRRTFYREDVVHGRFAGGQDCTVIPTPNDPDRVPTPQSGGGTS